MRISVKTQIALLFFVIACAIGVVTILIVNSIITNQIIYEAQERVKEHLSSARWVYNSKIREIDRIVYWTSIRHVLKKALAEKNVSAIKKELTGIMSQEGLDFLTLVDENRTVIYRFHNPEKSGDDLSADSFIKVSLEEKGVSGTQILTHEELLKDGGNLAKRARIQLVPTPLEKPTEKLEETSGMVLKSAYPVTDFNGRLIGVLTGGVLLNRNYELVDQIKNIVFKEAKYRGKEIGTATIFMGDLRIATNVIDKEGNRAVGTRVMKEVYEQVFERGLPWVQRAFVVDDWYITAYEPIRDIDDRIIGILYVGMLESKYTVMKERIILLFFLFSSLGMLLALTISFFFSWKMLKK
ncbi:MAG TPA: cache domain-containing protein [Thermodesulfobacteriota bacterium]|nr:cache domain-containing protein [Thermodesulfobacteriota bacterium]